MLNEVNASRESERGSVSEVGVGLSRLEEPLPVLTTPTKPVL